jgi:Rrf2 family protein
VLSRRTLSAIAAVLDVALLARSRPLSAKMLAGRHGLAPRQFESLLQDLVRGGILKSLRGPRGGYELARERRRISLGDIVRVLDAAKTREPAPPVGSSLIETVIRPAIAEAGQAFLGELDGVSVEELCRRAEATERAGTVEAADFHI